MPDEIFDVFLSHNSRDKPAVRPIAEALEGRGLRVWLDERELPPGRSSSEAEPLLRRALQIDEHSFGPLHPSIARDLNNLALLFHRTERLDETTPMALRAVDIFERSLGPDHPKTQSAQRTLDTFREQIAAQFEPPSSPEGAQA